MAELASLGIEVQATNVDQASSKLDKLSGAAKRAEAAVDGLGPASSKAGQMAARAADEATTALNAEAVAATKAAGAMRLHAAAANQNMRGMGAASMNVGNLAAQFQDIAVTSAMAMNPLQIALQQGTQISAVLGPMGAAGAVRALGSAFLAIISPVALVTIALVALVAAGLQMVEWPQLAAAALVGVADGLQVIAPYAVAAAAALALLYSPVIIGGLVQLIALLGRLSIAAVTLAASFAAANPALAFIIGITAAIAAANIFRDELAAIFGRDIVEDAKNGINGIIGAFVGGYEGIRATWSRLPAALGDIVVSTANAVITGIENMINRVSTAINGYIQSVNSMLGSLPFGVGEGMEIGSIGSVSLGRLDNSYAGAANAVESTIGSSMSEAMGRDYVGGFGEAISRGASAASAKLKELAKSLTEVDDKSKRKKGRGGKTEEEKYSDIVDGANRRITSLEAERAALGMTEEAAAALRYETELLNQAQQTGITLTEAQKGELSALGSVMASIETATKKAKEAMEFAQDVSRGFVDDFVSGLANGEGAWKSFANAAMNALSKIADKLMDSAFDSLFGGGAGGGMGGLFGGLFGGGASMFPSRPGVGLFASGGYTGSGAAHQAAGIVHGGEFVFSKKATDRLGVANLNSMHKRAKGYASGGHVAPVMPANANAPASQPSNTHVTVGVAVDDEGNLKAYVKNVARQESNASVRQYDAKLPSRIANAQKRRMA
ncbi:phage tail length tape measure family protein [Pseudorhizobium marinum]|uniref:phage tail length tape measure family protein n=1 Tax=Pseudorhizobium marinum TaxID=1496690 RepID=UPI00068CB0AB|nr:phage tail length tape measure family protein [Pseudorhizobium marinum]